MNRTLDTQSLLKVLEKKFENAYLFFFLCDILTTVFDPIYCVGSM